MCAHTTHFCACACMLAGGLVCERWEGIMYIVVCVYRLHIVVVGFFGDGVLLTLTKVLMGGYDKHYEVSRFLDNTLYSDYRLVTFYLR